MNAATRALHEGRPLFLFVVVCEGEDRTVVSGAALTEADAWRLAVCDAHATAGGDADAVDAPFHFAADSNGVGVLFFGDDPIESPFSWTVHATDVEG